MLFYLPLVKAGYEAKLVHTAMHCLGFRQNCDLSALSLSSHLTEHTQMAC